MRTFLLAGVMTLALSATASAQMCGGAMEQQSARTQSGTGCMGMKVSGAETTERSATKSIVGMMCPCCRNMANMENMKHGSVSGQVTVDPAAPSGRYPGD